MGDPDRDVLECLKENWQHARHVENERLSFTQFYAMIVGAVVTILVQWSSKGTVLICALAMFVLWLSVLGLLLARKWGQTFDKHMQRGRLAAERLGVAGYLVFPGEYSGLGAVLRTRHLFCYFYAAVIGVSVGVILYGLSNLLMVSTVVALVTAMLVSVFACRDPKRKQQLESDRFEEVAG